MLTARNNPRLVSSGTLATLTGITDSERLDAIYHEFVEFTLKFIDVYETWYDAWQVFWLNRNS